jgi:hypothetical protein
MELLTIRRSGQIYWLIPRPESKTDNLGFDYFGLPIEQADSKTATLALAGGDKELQRLADDLAFV